MFGRRLTHTSILLVACSVTYVGSAFAATITGKVTFEGKAPTMKPLAMDADPVCAKKHGTPVLAEWLVLGEGNTLGNVLVRVVKGVPDKTYPAPKDPVVMDQNGCQYIPHVMGVMVGQPFKVLNSDGVLHNVHSLPKVNKPFNMAMPPSRKEAMETFTKAEGMFTVKCDVHPWMQAFVGVMSNPFFAVTKPDGKFTISGLDAGTYEIEALHEKGMTRTATVTVGASDTKSVDFKFSPPGK